VGSLIACLALVLALASAACSAQEAPEAAVLVHELGQFQAEIDGRIDKRTGQSMPVEQRREAIYVKLRALGGAAIPALQRGLTDTDVQVRRNVALYLNFEGGNYAKHADAALDVAPFLPQLVAALRDEDERVIAMAAQAIAHPGSKAASAVPDLIRLVADRREGLRISAYIGLAGIGPAARDALPALRRALGDPHKDVRHFAQRAIDKIEPAKP
jgi:HEAT repeat protein